MHAFKWKGNEGVGWPATTLQLGNRQGFVLLNFYCNKNAIIANIQ